MAQLRCSVGGVLDLGYGCAGGMSAVSLKLKIRLSERWDCPPWNRITIDPEDFFERSVCLSNRVNGTVMMGVNR